MTTNALFYAGMITSLNLSSSLYSAVILTEDFEDATVNYTSSQPDDLSNIANSDYFGRIAADTSSPPPDVSYSNLQGSGYYGVQDTDATPSGNIDTITLDFVGIDISNYENISFSALFAEDDSSDGNEDWDTTSSLRVQYQIDNGGFNNLFAIESEIGTDGNQTNEVPRVDTDFDTIGDGAEITNVFTQYVAAISETGSTLDLRITIEDLETGDEDLAIDDITISGDLIPEPSTTLLGGLALLGLLRRRRPLS